MTAGETPGSRAMATGDGAPARGERWWPVAAMIVAAAVLHLALTAKYQVIPSWLAPAVMLALLAVLIMGDPGRIDRQKTWLRVTTDAVIALITLANLLAAGRLVTDILTSNKLFASNATGLLATGGVIWVTNVIAFGLWYWDLDRGGAAARAHHPYANPAFVFPEMLLTDYTPPTWVPQFADYCRWLLDRHRLQPDRRLRDQAVGQAADDDRGGGVPGHRRARDRPRDQHLEVDPAGAVCPYSGRLSTSHSWAAWRASSVDSPTSGVASKMRSGSFSRPAWRSRSVRWGSRPLRYRRPSASARRSA
jgi:hypothetical protein